MAITVSDVEDLLRVLREHPEWRERVRLEILGEEILSLPERMAGVERQLELLVAETRELRTATAELQQLTRELARRTDTIEARLEGIDTRLDRMDTRFDGIDARLDRVDGRLDRVDGRLDRVEGKVGNLEGWRFEQSFHAASRVARLYRRPVAVTLGELDAVLDGREAGTLSDHEFEQLARADFIFQARDGKGDGAPIVYPVLEVSITVDTGDVERARDRAALLRRVGLAGVAIVGGQVIQEDARKLAEEADVVVLVDRASEPPR